jgi:Mce-associated membrane protein
VTELDTASDLTIEGSEHPPADESPECVGRARMRFSRARMLVVVLLPLFAVTLAAAAGALWWHHGTVRDSDNAQVESTTSARDAAAALLSYQPDTVDEQLHAASAMLTGSFKDSYTQLTNDVVIPGAKQKQIASVASVSAVSSVSASPRHAVSLVFVDQTVTVGGGAPTATSSAIRVTLDKVDDRWLVSGFDPL